MAKRVAAGPVLSTCDGSRRASRNEMVSDVKDLMAMGAEARDSAAVIIALDNLIGKQRQAASSGLGMDVTLAGNKVLAPNLRNPSPVRDPDEVRGEDIHFYCVK